MKYRPKYRRQIKIINPSELEIFKVIYEEYHKNNIYGIRSTAKKQKIKTIYILQTIQRRGHVVNTPRAVMKRIRKLVWYGYLDWFPKDRKYQSIRGLSRGQIQGYYVPNKEGIIYRLRLCGEMDEIDRRIALHHKERYEKYISSGHIPRNILESYFFQLYLRIKKEGGL